MVEYDYDVAVIGAGPAGSTAAFVLATNGYRTLLIDRRQEIGLPIQCGELLPTPREIIRLFPSSKRAPRLVRVESAFITNRSNVISTIAPNGKRYSFPFAMNVIDRESFDKSLTEKAIQAGAELRTKTRFLGFSGPHSLVVNNIAKQHRITAKAIIGADGPSSIVAKSLGLSYRNRTRDMSFAMQYILSDTSFSNDEVLMFFGSQAAPGGYAWVIPKGNGMVNIGLGLRRSHSLEGVSLRNHLAMLLNHPQVKPHVANMKIESRVSALIPVGGPLDRTYTSNAILAGDAAGHVMASNGGGIPTALVAGEIAGQCVSDHIEYDVPLSKYEEQWKTEIGTELYTALMILRVADIVMSSDTLTSIAMSITGTHGLESVVRCRLPVVLSPLTPIASFAAQYLP